MAEITTLDGKPINSDRETRIVLTYDSVSKRLAVDGDVQNVDHVLNVLGQAQRYFDAVYRFQQAQIMAAQAQQERQVASLIARPH